MPIKYLNKVALSTAFSIIMILSSCQKATPSVVEEKKDEKICLSDTMSRMVTIDSAQLTDIADELKLSGEVSFDENKVVKVFPFASGQVLEVKVSVGDRVAKGQTLAVIKSADVAGSYADLNSSKTSIAMADRALQKAETLFKNGLGSEREVTEAQQNLEMAQKSSSKISEQISITGNGRTSAGGMSVITAPRSGYVLEKKINPGMFVRSDNTDNLFTVGDFDDVWVWANVYETDISKVKIGYNAKVTTLAYPDKVFVGKIDKISAILDPQAKVMKARISLPNPGLMLKPEMFTNVMIENKEGIKAVSIPARALVSENGRTYVVAYMGQCDMSIREVSILKMVEDRAYLSSGLKAGEKVISQNQILLFRQLSEK
jgi:membrane fusion protein, heavy metal efflux system